MALSATTSPVVRLVNEHMKQHTLLTITSLLSILLTTFHMTDDIIRRMEPGGLGNLFWLSVILAIWLYGALVLAGQRSGYVIVLIGSLLAVAVPVLHMGGAGVGARFADSGGAYFFIWTLLALGVNGTFSVVLAVRGLLSRAH